MSNDDLKLAFTWHVALQLVTADGVVTGDEKTWVRVRYAARAREAEFIDTDGNVTAKFAHALDEALVRLKELPREERLVIVDDIVDSVVADGEMQEEESRKLREALGLLGLGGADLDEVLSKRNDVGSVDLSTAEEG